MSENGTSPADAETAELRIEILGATALIKKILAGRAPEVQGAILADLLAIWLAGHHIAGDSPATRALRNDLLAMHLAGVEELVTINAKMLGTTPS